jgi:predicted cupin superfamily sugar epimerase
MTHNPRRPNLKTPDMDDAVRRIVERFELVPHPEGGYFREVYRSATKLHHPGLPPGAAGERSAGTLIYFLLSGKDFSAFHRVRFSDEIWHLYAGGPLEIHLIDAAGQLEQRRLTTNVQEGEPTTMVPAGTWQSARLADGASFALGGCSVAPGFEYDDFEMPTALELIERFPGHVTTIRALTRR